MRLRHIVTTRMGLGMRRPSFFRRHIALMAETLVPSLAAQTRQDFEWILATDTEIDDANWAELERVLAPYPNFRAVKLDPFKHGLSPRLASILPEGVGEADLVAVSRVDDDDALAKDFVETVRREALASEGGYPRAIAFPNGVQVDPSTGRFAPYTAEFIALGLTLVSRADSPMDIFGLNHTHVGAHVSAAGGEVRVVADGGARWIYARSPASDSGEALRVSGPDGDSRVRLPKPSFDLSDEKAVERVLRPALERCGLSMDWLETIKALRAGLPDHGPDIAWDPPMKRMLMKGALLRSRRTWIEKGWPTEPLDCAFYMI